MKLLHRQKKGGEVWKTNKEKGTMIMAFADTHEIPLVIHYKCNFPLSQTYGKTLTKRQIKQLFIYLICVKAYEIAVRELNYHPAVV